MLCRRNSGRKIGNGVGSDAWLPCESSKSNGPCRFAAIIEPQFRNPTTDVSGDTVITINESESEVMNDLMAAAYAVIRDSPDIFYYKAAFNASLVAVQASLFAHLLYTLQDIAAFKNETESRRKRILAQIDRRVNAWERERQLYKSLQTHIDYADSGSPEQYSIIGPLLHGRGVCEGISKTFAVLYHQLGIPCIVVFDSKHMWNMVRIDGELSHVDVTYSTGCGGVCDYSYFNIPDSEMLCNHDKEVLSVPPCKSAANGYYHRTGKFFRNGKQHETIPAQGTDRQQTCYPCKAESRSIKKAISGARAISPKCFSYSAEYKACGNSNR